MKKRYIWLIAACLMLSGCGDGAESDLTPIGGETAASAAESYSQEESDESAEPAAVTQSKTLQSVTTTEVSEEESETTTTATSDETTTTTTTTTAAATTATTAAPTQTTTTKATTASSASTATTTTAVQTKPVTTTEKQEDKPQKITAPEAVSFMVCTGSERTGISWDAVSGAEGYVIWVKRSEDGKWERIGETTKTAFSFDEGRNRDYSFCVKAYCTDKDGERLFSEKAHVSAFPYLYKKDGVTYVDGMLIVNKTYSLPKNYGSGLTSETTAAFNEMQKAAANEGISLWICSGFRSYSYQSSLYWGYVARDGSQQSADRYSARAGHSEHQSGLAMDINNASSYFNNTKEAKWLAENCYKYGFIIRYPEGKEAITGYKYESWHCRYVGKERAKELYDSGLTVEEFYGLTSKYSD